MNRSQFLAVIPSLSALPFIGKEIIRKSDRIEIYQPEEAKQIAMEYDSRWPLVYVVDQTGVKACRIDLCDMQIHYGMGGVSHYARPRIDISGYVHDLDYPILRNIFSR